MTNEKISTLDNKITMNEQIEKLIESLELELLQPDVRKTISRIGELIADDFVEFAASGNRYDKNDILDHLPKLEEVKYSTYDFAVQKITPDVMMATYRVEKESLGGERASSLRSSLWRNNNGSWQMFFHQGTPQN